MVDLERTIFATVPKPVFESLCDISSELGVSVATLASAVLVGVVATFNELNPAGADNNK